MIAGQLSVELQQDADVVRPPKTLLIVEDESSIAEVLAIRLQQQGYETAQAKRGKEAIQIAQQAKPDLILLDLRLPDIDGLEVCQTLADDSRTCDVPVIILSGMESPDVIRRCRRAGCRYYVRKPYDPDVLLLLIDQAIAEADFPSI